MIVERWFPGAVVDHDASCGQWTLEFREAGSLPPCRDIYIGWTIDICMKEERGWRAASNTLKLCIGILGVDI